MENKGEIYNQQYYKEIIARGSAAPYTDSTFWGDFYAKIARKIVDTLHPKTVLDAGCALGYLVAALRDLGVEAYGIDISEYAISSVQEKIKDFCYVGSLCEKLPDELPQSYDLVLCIEVLEHLSAEDGVIAINNLCKYSDHILFSSSPDDFEDITHINVQQREYWAKIFAKNDFYDEISCRPTWVAPQAVLYQKKDNAVDAIVNFERFIRRIDMESKTKKEEEFLGKIYFDFGNGYYEENAYSFAFQSGRWFKKRFDVPAGCKSVRFDPVEGYGCVIRNLNVMTESTSVNLNSTNGTQAGELQLFKTIDPQLYFADIPTDTHWIEVEAEVSLFNSTTWVKIYDYLVDLENNRSGTQKRLDEAYITIDHQKKELMELGNNYHDLICEYEKNVGELSGNQVLLTELEHKCTEYQKEITDYSNLVTYERGEVEKLSVAYSSLLQTYNGILATVSWRITKPLRFSKKVLRKVFSLPIRALRLLKKTASALKKYGLKVTLKKIRNKLTGRKENILTPAVQETPMTVSLPNNIIRSTITGNPVDPIQTILVNEPVKRLNLVTDTINSDSLLGGVATALIVATEFANRWGYELRIITRNTETNPLNYENIIRISGIQPAQKVSFYSDYQRFEKCIDFKMEISPDDIFFATSWWSAMAIAETTIRKRFFYIIQEVETFFYNYGGERMLCEQVMQNPNIDFIINSGYLHKYFAVNEPQIVENGCYFEPAFPKDLYSKKVFTDKKDKYKLFFYARPNNPRNLYAVGVEMLKKAVQYGILDTDEWDIYCVGQNAPIITFENGAQTKNLGQLSWTEYAKFLADVDLGLCLMYTPHPSYPPFDVASSGGVVLSNKMLNKTSFDMCENVILTDLEEMAFMDSFKEAVKLAKDMEQRKKNYEENTIPRDWHVTLENTIANMKGKCNDV